MQAQAPGLAGSNLKGLCKQRPQVRAIGAWGEAPGGHPGRLWPILGSGHRSNHHRGCKFGLRSCAPSREDLDRLHLHLLQAACTGLLLLVVPPHHVEEKFGLALPLPSSRGLLLNDDTVGADQAEDTGLGPSCCCLLRGDRVEDDMLHVVHRLPNGVENKGLPQVHRELVLLLCRALREEVVSNGGPDQQMATHHNCISNTHTYAPVLQGHARLSTKQRRRKLDRVQVSLVAGQHERGTVLQDMLGVRRPTDIA